MLNDNKSFVKTKIIRFLENKLFLFFGNISFSLYCWHFFAIYLSRSIFNGLTLYCVLLPFVFAIVSFCIFENKNTNIFNYLHKRFKNNIFFDVYRFNKKNI